jgi:hypothetical protein
MDQKQMSRRWWEAVTLLLAINSIVFGVLFGSGNQFGWAIVVGFAPGVLLLVGLKVRKDNRGLATVLITVSAIAASGAFWMIYPAVLALVVIIGGFVTGKIGPARRETAIA